MKLFDVYPLFNIEIVKGKGCHVWDKEGNEYLDLYGGHAVISVGHSHPTYVKAISEQVSKLGFYSNSVINSLQQTLADKLGKASGYDEYSLFLINSGAEANENALKLASFHNGKKRVLAFQHSFHGRTSAAVRVTDNPKIIAPVNEGLDVSYLPLNDKAAVEAELKKGDVSSVIIEGIQGVGGIQVPTDDFLQELRSLCTKYQAVLIIDEIQSGYGRSGKFFAHQYAGKRPAFMGNPNHETDELLRIHHAVPALQMNGYGTKPLAYKLWAFTGQGFGGKLQVDFTENDDDYITLGRFNPAGDTMCIKKGKVIRSEYADTYCSPFYYIQMDDAREFMHNLAGFGHHQVLIFGDYTKMIKKIAKIMNFNILEG